MKIGALKEIVEAEAGWLYQNGWGVPQDYAEAMRWYQTGEGVGFMTSPKRTQVHLD